MTGICLLEIDLDNEYSIFGTIAMVLTIRYYCLESGKNEMALLSYLYCELDLGTAALCR